MTVPKIKSRKVENGFIVSVGKKEVFCAEECEGWVKAKQLFMSDVAPDMALKVANDLFPAKPEAV